MKVKFIIVIILMLFVFCNINYARSCEYNMENEESVKGEEKNSRSITDPENNVENGSGWVSVTYRFDGATYNEIEENYFTEVYALNTLVDKPDSDLFDFGDYIVDYWVTDVGYEWDFENDIVSENLTLYVVWEYNPNCYIMFEDSEKYIFMNNYFDFLYPNNAYCDVRESKTTSDITGENPINIRTAGDRFNDEELENVRESLPHPIHHYGGCGPFAMIGMMDYFANAMDIRQIMIDVNDVNARKQLAKDVYLEVNTFAFGLTNDTKSVGTAPAEYVRAFNKLMKDYFIYSQLKAKYNTRYVSKEVKLSQIKDSIDNGVPVTCYTIFRTDGDVGSHYMNIYGYEEWEVIENGETFIETFIMVRLNFENITETVYLKSDFLDSHNVGLITYIINPYDNAKLITANDFSKYFINDGANYMTDAQFVNIHNIEGYYFEVKRNRCACVDGQLILSSNKTGCGEASLELIFNETMRTVSFDLSLFSPNEEFTDGSKFEFRYYNEQSSQWITSVLLNVSQLSTDVENFEVEVPSGIRYFCFYLECVTPNSELDLGRLKIDNIVVSYVPGEQHYHQYTYTHNTIKHTATCDCGDTYTETHTFKTNLVMGKLQKSCITCGYIVDMDNDFVVASLPKDDLYELLE